MNTVMSINERWKYLSKMQQWCEWRVYGAKCAPEWKRLQACIGSSLIRCINGDLEHRPRRQLRGRTYGSGVDDAIRLISESLDHICAERLTPCLVTTAQQLARHGEIFLSLTRMEQLERISVSTARRILKRFGQDQPRRRRKPSGTSNAVARSIPISRIAWDEKQPGHFEVDLDTSSEMAIPQGTVGQGQV